MALYTDRLFRVEQGATTSATAAAAGTATTGTTTTSEAGAVPANVTVRATPEMRAEAGRIFATQLTEGGMSDADKAYLAQEVAQVTGVPPAEAQKRVADASAAITDAENKAKAAAEAARKAAATGAFFTAFSLLIGAFIGELLKTMELPPKANRFRVFGEQTDAVAERITEIRSRAVHGACLNA